MELANTFQGLRYKKIKKGVVCELPAGILYLNDLLSNNGPVVPIKLNFIGYVTTNIETEAKTYGINSVYLEIFIHVEVIEQISMPLLTKSVKTEVDIPLTIKIIQGVIPDYYQSGLQRDSQIYSLPIE